MKRCRISAIGTLNFFRTRRIQVFLNCFVKFLTIGFIVISFNTKVSGMLEFLVKLPLSCSGDFTKSCTIWNILFFQEGVNVINRILYSSR